MPRCVVTRPTTCPAFPASVPPRPRSSSRRSARWRRGGRPRTGASTARAATLAATAAANSPCSEKPTRTELSMTDKVFCDVSISADGYVAGAGQTADEPFGDGPVDRLHAWMFDTPDENRAEIDAIVSAGAFVMGRNMFGPVRGQWDRSWTGWWRETPPYHAPVVVLTHHPRDPPTRPARTPLS